MLILKATYPTETILYHHLYKKVWKNKNLEGTKWQARILAILMKPILAPITAEIQTSGSKSMQFETLHKLETD